MYRTLDGFPEVQLGIPEDVVSLDGPPQGPQPPPPPPPGPGTPTPPSPPPSPPEVPQGWWRNVA